MKQPIYKVAWLRPVCLLVCIACGAAARDAKNGTAHQLRPVGTVDGPWTKERAKAWYRSVGPIRGVNYLPRTAVNDVEMWDASSFDPQTINQELGWAHEAGYNSLRAFLPFVVWQQDPVAFKKRFDRFLSLAQKHGLTVAPILFDDVAFAGKEPRLGRQDAPIPGVHNSQWVPSPGKHLSLDPSARPQLRAYVDDMVRTYKEDTRIIFWDLYNEPGNNNLGASTLSLVRSTFEWARSQHSSQPLTTGIWMDFEGEESRQVIALSDILTYHDYSKISIAKFQMQFILKYGKPVICTEWLRRQVGNTFDVMLPLFESNDVGWYSWGLVAGRTQTYMPWGSKPGGPEPKLWQHDLLRPDGKPFDPHEIQLIRRKATVKAEASQ